MSTMFQLDDTVSFIDHSGNRSVGKIAEWYSTCQSSGWHTETFYTIDSNNVKYCGIPEAAMTLLPTAGLHLKDGSTPAKAMTKVLTKDCEHSYKKYTGLFETYDYCEKCDQKRGK